MKSMRGLTLAVTTIALTMTWGRAQTTESGRVLEAARETMSAARYCFLVTLDEAGQPQARLMDPFEPGTDLTVWLATNPKTRKVDQIRRDPRVTLAYSDAQGHGYVALIGRARLVEDLSERRRRWKPDWTPFYPDGPEGEDYVLIEVTPSRIEVMSMSQNVADDPLGWKPAILRKSNGRWLLDQH